MKTGTTNISQRLIRKGALVEATYQLFRLWNPKLSFDANFDNAFQGGFSSNAWSKEVQITLRRRFRGMQNTQPLIVLAHGNYPLTEWRYCLLLWIASNDSFFGDFLLNWLYPEYKSGRLQIRAEAVAPHVRSAWKRLNKGQEPLSDYGVVRTARDLLRMARDLGLIEGDGPAKVFAPVHYSDAIMVYACQMIAELEGSSAKVTDSDLWKSLLLDTNSVHGLLLHLHQYRKLDYQVAGSIVQLTLPCASAREYAERMVA